MSQRPRPRRANLHRPLSVRSCSPARETSRTTTFNVVFVVFVCSTSAPPALVRWCPHIRLLVGVGRLFAGGRVPVVAVRLLRLLLRLRLLADLAVLLLGTLAHVRDQRTLLLLLAEWAGVLFGRFGALNLFWNGREETKTGTD